LERVLLVKGIEGGSYPSREPPREGGLKEEGGGVRLYAGALHQRRKPREEKKGKLPSEKKRTYEGFGLD